MRSSGDPAIDQLPTDETADEALLTYRRLLGRRLYQHCWVRLGVAAAIVVAGIISRHVLGLTQLDTDSLDLLAACIVAYDVVAWFVFRRFRAVDVPPASYARLLPAAYGTVVLDFLALTFAIWLLGGARSPFVAYYIPHIILSSVLLSLRGTIALTGLALGLLLGLVGLELLGIAPPRLPEGAVACTLPLRSEHAVVLLVVYSGLFGLASFLLLGLNQSLRRGERRMHVANAELQRLSEQRRDFLRIAVHNLKAPLGAVTMFLTNMQDGLAGPVTDKQREWIDRCLKRLEEQSTFLQEMQVLSSLEKEIIRSTYTRVDLGEIVERLIADHADIAMENGLELRLHADRQVRPVLGHERLLREAVVNYISNALKYTPTGGHVEVRLRQRGPNVRVEVADDGEGIAREDQARLFGEFVRILRPGSAAERVKGTGLGLSLVKRIVDAHNGSVGVESEPGVGSTFWLELPGLFE
jgi:signal transduction histidine kinase